jgi:RimJ/RimL family protein N-acetyltransferase
MLDADRLVIYAASEREMNRIIEAEQDEERREAYEEMLRGSLEHPDDWGWYAIWLIMRKDGTNIGNLSFKGTPDEGIVEIGYGIAEEYRGFGYATEALETILEWAFEQPGVTCVAAETAPDNAASRRVLEKCGFKPTGTVGREGPRFIKEPDEYSYS